MYDILISRSLPPEHCRFLKAVKALSRWNYLANVDEMDS